MLYAAQNVNCQKTHWLRHSGKWSYTWTALVHVRKIARQSLKRHQIFDDDTCRVWFLRAIGTGRTGQIFVYFAKKSVTSSLRQVRPVNLKSTKFCQGLPNFKDAKFLSGVKSDRFVNLDVMIWRKMSIKKIWSLFLVGIFQFEARQILRLWKWISNQELQGLGRLQ